MKFLLLVLALVVVSTGITCQSGQTYVKIRKQNTLYASEESFVIKSGTSVVYSSPTLVNNELFEVEQCFTPSPNDQYSLELIDSEGDGWSAGTWIEFVGEFNNIFFRAMPLEDEKETYTLSLYYCIKKNQEWKITTNASGTWMNVDYSDALWTTLTLGSTTQTLTGTQYFRKSFVGLVNMSAYEASMNYRCGIVAYINGVEIFRDNMAEGPTSSSILATGCYSSLEYHGVIRPGTEVANAQSVLAVEIHYLESSASNAVDFDSFVALYGNTIYNTNCYIAHDGINVTPDKGTNKQKMFDWNYNTFLLLHTSSAPLKVNFEFTKSIPYINGLRIWPYSYDTYAPGDFTFGGKNDGTTYNTVMDITDLAYTTKVDTIVYSYFSASLYKEYKLFVTATVSATSLRIYELHPLVCGLAIPTSITFEPSSVSNIAAYEAVTIKPTIDEFTGCTINPALPTGVTINPQTCIITGLSDTIVPATTYTVTSVMNGNTYTGTFTLEFHGCSGQVVDFYRTYRANAAYEYFEVIDDTTQQVVYSEGAGTVQINLSNVHHYVCLTNNKYTINLHSTIAYWQSLSFLYVRGMFDYVLPQSSLHQYENIIRAKFDSNLGLPATYTFYPQYQIPHSQNWYYKMGEVPANWYNSDTSGWTEKPSTGYPVSSNQIQLYKKTFTVNSLTGAAVVINIKYMYGCVVYLNNHEVFRNGVSDTLSTSSFSSTSYTEARYHQISLPVKTFMIDGVPSVDYITTGTNTIAIALVAATATQTESVFDCAVRVMGHNVQSRYLNDFTITGSGTSGSNVSSFAFHHFSNSFYSSSCSTDNYINVKFNYDRREWVSSLGVQLYYTQTNQYLRQFVLKARNPEDGDSWTTLKTVTGMTWSQAGQLRKVYVLNNKPYNEYRFEGFGTGDPSNCYWKFSRIDLMSDAQVPVPDLTYEHSSFSIFKDIEMAEEYAVGEYYMDFTVTPPLPTGITIDPNSGIISGTAHETAGSQTYTISAKKYTGEMTSTAITITVEVCTGGKSLITMVARTDSSPDQSSYTLYQGKGTSGTVVSSITAFPTSSALYYADFCVNHDIYTLQLKDTSTGWNNPGGYYLTIDYGEMKFEMGYVTSTTSPTAVTTMFSSYLPFQIDYDDWKVYKNIEDVAEDWNTASFDDSTWLTTKAKDIGAADATTVYIRRTFTIPNLNDYQVLNVRVKYAGGVVAYFNGRKVARFNLAASFTPITESITQHDSDLFSKFHIILNTVGATTEKNVVAFEIHRPQGQSSIEPVVFDATGIFGVNDCSIVVDTYSDIDGTAPTGSIILKDLFDLTPVTYGYLPNAVGSHIDWTVENLEGSKFNSYAWQTVFERTQWGFSLYARKDENDEFLDAFHTNNQATVARGRVAFNIPVGIAGFSQFKYEIDATPSSFMSFSAQFFQYCKPSGAGVCGGIDDYPPVGEGQISPGPCEYGFTGYSYRTCTGGTLGEIMTDKCIHKLPENLLYQSERFTFVLGINAETLAPSYDWIISSFRLHDGTFLPEGLSLDPVTGNISGTPTSEVSLKTYTIYGENERGAISTTVNISVRKGECKADGHFPKTSVGEIAQYECSVAGSYIGTQKRACILGARDGEWQKIQGTCIPVSLLIIIVIIVIFLVAFLTFFLVRTTKKTKAVGGVKGKVSKQSKKITMKTRKTVKV